MKGKNQAVLHNILHRLVQDYNKLIMEDKVVFKKVLRRYQSIYSFLSQLIQFTDVNLEKLYIFVNAFSFHGIK